MHLGIDQQLCSPHQLKLRLFAEHACSCLRPIDQQNQLARARAVPERTGVTAMVLAAIVVSRWFEARRGLVLGVLSAANATGQLVFLPLLARLVTYHGWRSAVYVVAACAGLVFLSVLCFMKDKPSDLGLHPYGAQQAEPSSTQVVVKPPLRGLAWAAKSREFWILAGTFFVCGASTNG